MTAPSKFRSRAILLGASNLTLGLGLAIRRVRSILPAPVQILVADGPGRSWAHPSTVLGRGLPSIRDCHLWERTGSGPSIPTLALLTDVGNDLPHDVPPREIAASVEACLERLVSIRASLTLTLLPLDSIERLGRARYLFFRTLFFPSSRLPRDRLFESARELQEHLRQLGARHRALVVAPRRDWFGLDPIHPRWHHRREMWNEFIPPPDPGTFPPSDPKAVPRFDNPVSAFLRPDSWSILGKGFRGQQPARVLRDGSVVEVY